MIFSVISLSKNKSSVQEGVAPIIFKKRAPRKPIPSSGNIKFLLGVRSGAGRSIRRRNAVPVPERDAGTELTLVPDRINLKLTLAIRYRIELTCSLRKLEA